jgi:type III secretion protein R
MKLLEAGRALWKRHAHKVARKPMTRSGEMAARLFALTVWVTCAILIPSMALAKKGGGGGNPSGGNALGGVDLTQAEGVANKPLVLMTALGALSLLPFVIIMVTSFVKMAVVLSIIRQALGTQQIPPTQVITGLAIILTVYVMHPVGLRMKRAADAEVNMTSTGDMMKKENIDLLIKAGRKAEGPFRDFLMKHSHEKDRQMFYKVAYRLRDPVDRDDLKITDLIIVVPSFVISELTEAFQIGFVIFLPFLVIDMVVSNILMALGMQMLSPTTISLPFKILLFVLVDGWYLLTKGLVLGYQ